MKNFIIIALMLFTFTGFSQNQFVGQWVSTSSTINVSFENDSLIVTQRNSRLRGYLPIEVLSAKIKDNKLFIKSYFKPNNWHSELILTIGVIENQGHGVIKNTRGSFNLVYTKNTK